MGEILTSIILGGVYILGGIVFILRQKNEIKKLTAEETKGENE